jgi:hypothetical protein
MGISGGALDTGGYNKTGDSWGVGRGDLYCLIDNRQTLLRDIKPSPKLLVVAAAHVSLVDFGACKLVLLLRAPLR